MDGHPPKTPAIFFGEPMVQAHIRVPDSVNRSEWLKRKSGRRTRRSSVHGGSRHAAGGTSIDGRGKLTTERNFSPPPRDRDLSVDSRTSSIASSTSTTASRLSMVSLPPQPTQPRQDNNSYKPGARRNDAVGGRGRRRLSFDLGPPRAAAAAAATTSAAASAETLSSSSTSSSTRCAVCLADFTRYRRPHRCRACGKTVCATCSPARMPKRACKRCAGGHFAPRVAATVSPPRQAAVAPYALPYAPPTGVARAARRSVGVGSTIVLFAGVPSKPIAVVAGATHPIRASPRGPKEVDRGELEGPNSPDRANASKKGLKASESVSGVGEGDLEESASLAGGSNEEVEGLDRLNEEVGGLDRRDGDRVETGGAFGDTSHIEDAVRSFPNGVLSNSSPTRVERKSTAAEPDQSVVADSVASGRDGRSPLSCGASDNTEGQVACGPEAAIVDVDRTVSSEGAGDGGRELAEAVGWCLPAESSVELAASPVVGGDSSDEDEVLKPPVNEDSAPEGVAESEDAAATSCAAATPPHSSPQQERAEQQCATTNSEEVVLEPYAIESTAQPETALFSETADQVERAAAQPEEEGLGLPHQVLSQPIRQRVPFEEDSRAEEEGEGEEEEEEAGLSVKDTRERSADEDATGIETTSSKAVLHKHHKEEEEEEEVVGEEQEDGVAHEMENKSVKGRADNEQRGTEGVLAATAGFCGESSVEESPMGTDGDTTDLAVADAPQDKRENEPWDDESKGATVEGNDGYQREAQEVVRAHIAGLRLGNGGDEGPLAAERGTTGSIATAARPGSEQERGEDKDVEEVVAMTVGGQHGEGGVDLSIADRGSDAESPVSEHTAVELEGDVSLLITPLTDNDAERRGASSQDQQAGDKEKEEDTAAVTAVGPKAEGPNDKAAGLADSDPAGRALSPATSASLDEEGRGPGQEVDTTESVAGRQEFGDHERGVAKKSIIAPALTQDEDVADGGLQRTVEPPSAPFSGVPEGAGNDNDGGPDAAAGEDCGGETAAQVAAPPPASHSNPPTTKIGALHGAEGGDVSFARGVVLAEGGEGAGGFLGVLKELFRKGGSCCR